MKVNIETETILTPKSLAIALANSTTTEFADFWFEFSKACDKSKLDGFAKGMSDDFGGARRNALIDLYMFMNFHRESYKRWKETCVE